MSALAVIQSDFQDYVLGAGGAAPAIAAAVLGQRGLAAEERLAIYHRAYRIRMREALGEAYEKTWTYAGDALFDGLAESYLAAHPSGYRNLRWFGDQFAAHAARELPDYPFVAELAQFEWTLGLAFDAPDAPALSMDDLRASAGQDWGGLRLGLHPSVHLLQMDFNSVGLWQALHDGVDPPAPERQGTPGAWLVWRAREQPHFRSLDANEARALRSIIAGASFAQVCEELAGYAGDATSCMAAYLQSWLAQGLLTAPQAVANVRI